MGLEFFYVMPLLLIVRVAFIPLPKPVVSFVPSIPARTQFGGFIEFFFDQIMMKIYLLLRGFTQFGEKSKRTLNLPALWAQKVGKSGTSESPAHHPQIL